MQALPQRYLLHCWLSLLPIYLSSNQGEFILSVVYKVNSRRGVQFRIWATQKLGEYVTKGFVRDDDHLARGMTQAEITRQLSSRMKADGSRNPKTNQPYDKATICRDVKVIRNEWRENTLRDTDAWLAEEMTALREARCVAEQTVITPKCECLYKRWRNC